MLDVSQFFTKMKNKFKASSFLEEADDANVVSDISEMDYTDKDIVCKYSPILLYCEVPQTVSLKKRAFIEQQCVKYHIEREKSCEIL